MRLSLRRLTVPALVAVLLPAFAHRAEAQFPGQGGFRGGSGFVLGGRAGYDFESDGPMLGAFARSSVWGRFSVQATGDLTFLDGLTERQAGADLLVEVSRGFHVGGGGVLRNSIYGADAGAPRETRSGWSAVALLGGTPGPGRIVSGLELRFTRVDDYDSQLLSLQVGVALLRW